MGKLHRPLLALSLVGVVGPSRTAEGTGPYVIDFLRRAGAVGVAVRGSTFGSSRRLGAIWIARSRRDAFETIFSIAWPSAASSFRR